MTNNQLKCIAKFIDAANVSWNEPRFYYRIVDDKTLPVIVVSSDSDYILSLVTAISSLFCGAVVSFVSDIHRFTFEIY